MKEEMILPKSANSKGANIFKKMLEDKKAISSHLQSGGTIDEIKHKYRFVKVLQLSKKG